MRNLLLVLLTFVLLAGMTACTQSPQEVLQDAVVKTAKIDSYSFEAQADMTLNLQDVNINHPMAGMLMSMLGNISLTAEGKVDAANKKAEFMLSLALPGDVAMTLNIPIIVENDILYVKVPNMPFFPLPSALTGKYIVIDLAKLDANGQQSEAVPDHETLQGLVRDLSAILIADFGDSKYLTALNKNDLPEEVDAAQVFEIRFADEDLEDIVSTFVTSTMPKVLDLLSEDRYRETLNVQVEAIEQMRHDLQQFTTDNDEFAQFRENVTLNESTVLFGVSDGYLVHQNFIIDATVKEDGVNTNYRLNLTQRMYNINQKQTFEFETPSESNTITLEQLQALFGGQSF